MDYSVLIDTCFMVGLLNANSIHHKNAKDYFRYFLDNDIPIYFSTISVAEYCIRGEYDTIPFEDVRILPFTLFDGKETGRFGQVLYKARLEGILDKEERIAIPNDAKLFAQASIRPDIRYFVTSDVKAKKKIDIIRRDCGAQVAHLDISTPINVFSGQLDLED